MTIEVYTDADLRRMHAEVLATKGIDTDADPSPKPGAAKLRRYWTRGEGAAKIGWGTAGDFKRCVGHLRKYVGTGAEGLCNVYHRSATGHAPGQGPHAGGKALTDTELLSWDTKDWVDSLSITSTETKADDMTIDTATGADLSGADVKTESFMIEYKDVGVRSLEVVDEEKGIVDAIVSVTGIKDNVNDIILPGAYEKTLGDTMPKCVWAHDWKETLGKPIWIKELMPGDPELPTLMPNGDPWPSQAGALKVRNQFNMGTQRGRDAYSDAVFFGNKQAWSIGYQVPPGAASVSNGIRQIKALKLFEYSMVLHGAAPAAHTTSVKTAQIAHHRSLLSPIEFKSWLMEVKEAAELDGYDVDDPIFDFKDDSELPVSEQDLDGVLDPEEGDDEIEYDDDDADLDDDGLKAYELEVLTKAYHHIGQLIGVEEVEVESKEDRLADLVEGAGLDDDLTAELKKCATDFDTALADGDTDLANKAAIAFLDVLDEKVNGDEGVDDDTYGTLQDLAVTMIKMGGSEPDYGDDEDEEKAAVVIGGDAQPDEDLYLTKTNDDGVQVKVLPVEDYDMLKDISRYLDVLD